ncbi:acylphosphatase [Flaviflexus huanghaiensis]|uniref:acylphosphatase n=1 Tax=Flaviflexus huanghaiensis TaxID=1111473 RepID=UPI0015FA9BB4|nr:acylphosphatase [Flaviflexus huanghaiensis]
MRVVATTITGRVQGVGYRYSAARRARELKLAGWVRNTEDGSVEALLIGEDASVAKMLDWCAVGPPAARVAAVHTADLEPGDYADVSGFDIREGGGA